MSAGTDRTHGMLPHLKRGKLARYFYMLWKQLHTRTITEVFRTILRRYDDQFANRRKHRGAAVKR